MMYEQLSIFDFLKVPSDWDSITEADVYKSVADEYGPGKKDRWNRMEWKIGGVKITTGSFDHYYKGVRDERRFIPVDFERRHGEYIGGGTTAESIEEVRRYIREKVEKYR